MLGLYNAILLPLRLIATLGSRWFSAGGPERAAEWRERTARTVPESLPGCVWIHGASLGEARLVGTLVDAIRTGSADRRIAVSAYSRTGRAALPEPPVVDRAFFMPLDFRGLPGRILDALRTSGIVLVETELWPNLLAEASERSIPVVVVNGRLSPRRMARYRRLSALYRPLLKTVRHIAAQSEADAARFRDLGVDPGRITVTGNLKFDLAAPVVDAPSLRRNFGIESDRPVVVAGSTGSGEDPTVLDAFERLRPRHPRAVLVLAPRHPERADDVVREIASRDLTCHRLSGGREWDAGGSDVVVVDTVGQLAQLYALGDAAFVGGSLVPVGGHNVLEPALVGVPVLFGPYVDHFREPAEALLAAGGAIQVDDTAALASAWERLIDDPGERARIREGANAVLQSNRGAIARTMAILENYL